MENPVLLRDWFIVFLSVKFAFGFLTLLTCWTHSIHKRISPMNTEYRKNKGKDLNVIYVEER